MRNFFFVNCFFSREQNHNNYNKNSDLFLLSTTYNIIIDETIWWKEKEFDIEHFKTSVEKLIINFKQNISGIRSHSLPKKKKNKMTSEKHTNHAVIIEEMLESPNVIIHSQAREIQRNLERLNGYSSLDSFNSTDLLTHHANLERFFFFLLSLQILDMRFDYC